MTIGTVVILCVLFSVVMKHIPLMSAPGPMFNTHFNEFDVGIILSFLRLEAYHNHQLMVEVLTFLIFLLNITTHLVFLLLLLHVFSIVHLNSDIDTIQMACYGL